VGNPALLRARNRPLAVVDIGGLLAIVVACGAAAAVTATDDSGNVVTLARPAQRIVSLAPHATELLFAAGAGNRVVGVLSPADWPPEAAQLPKVGDASAVNLEGILALKPDLIVTWPCLAPTQLDWQGNGTPDGKNPFDDPKLIEHCESAKNDGEVSVPRSRSSSAIIEAFSPSPASARQ